MGRRIKFLARRRFLIPFVALFVLVGLAVAIYKNLNSPAEGIIAPQPLSDSTEAKSDSSKPKHYSDKYLSFDYPAVFEVSPTEKNKGYFSSVKLISGLHHDEFVAIGLYPGSLTSDSGINYRLQHPDRYKVVTRTAGSAVFSGIGDVHEYTGFIVHADKVLSVSLTSVGAQDLSEGYKMIAGSLQWK